MVKTPILQVSVSCPPEQAEALAQALVAARCAACVQIVPGVRSVYRWQGAVEQSNESLLLIKLPQSRLPALHTLLLAQHPYELPEIIAVNIAHGHPPYLQWIEDACA